MCPQACPPCGCRCCSITTSNCMHSQHVVRRKNLPYVPAGVPTVWLSLLSFMEARGLRGFTTFRMAVIGGAAAPRAMIEAFEKKWVVRCSGVVCWLGLHSSPCSSRSELVT